MGYVAITALALLATQRAAGFGYFVETTDNDHGEDGDTPAYVAVHNKGCSDYIHMDYGDYGGVDLEGGSTSLEECAAAVQAYSGQDGCMGNYFFFEDAGYCNCPTDDCSLDEENHHAGSDGQLYMFTGNDEDDRGDDFCGGGICFALYHGADSADDAEERCVSYGGHLGKIENEEQFNAYDALAATLDDQTCVFFGADIRSGNWTYRDGSATFYMDVIENSGSGYGYGYGDPSGSGEECSCFWVDKNDQEGGSKYYDAPCDSTYGQGDSFICFFSSDDCPATCFGETCDAWIEAGDAGSCEDIETWERTDGSYCDCSGCNCANTPSPTAFPSYSPTTKPTPVANDVRHCWNQSCGKGCFETVCDSEPPTVFPTYSPTHN